MVNRLAYYMKYFFFSAAVMLAGAACNQAANASSAGRKHLVEINKNGDLLYVDKTSISRVMKETGDSYFSSYVIGFADSIKGNSKSESEKTLYFQYRMSNDWKAVLNGDSLLPVFFQPVTKLNSMTREGIIVFELPGGQHPDTLVFNDSFGQWEQQVIVLNQKL